jgi:hypothetical protein
MIMLDLRQQTIAGAAVTWLVPLLASFGLFNPSTGAYLPNYLGFKLIMAALAALCTLLSYRWIARSGGLTPGMPATYLVANAALDLAVLVIAFGMPVTVWASTVLTVYVAIFVGLYFMMRRP